MTVSAEKVRFDGDRIWVDLSDGRIFGLQLSWFPRLLQVTLAQRNAVAISPFGRGLHWAEFDGTSR